MTPGQPDQELEIKRALSAEDYLVLAKGLEHRLQEVTQRNLFFDTADGALANSLWALRLRHEQPDGQPPQIRVTIKGAAQRVAGAVRRTEVETPGNETLWQQAQAGALPLSAVPGPPGDLLREALEPGAVLACVLGFSNHRTRFRARLGGSLLLLELDRTSFDTGEVDHELELELPAVASAPEATASREIRAVSADLDGLLARLGVRADTAGAGKYARALRYAGLGQ